jgi:hypothetical protein
MTDGALVTIGELTWLPTRVSFSPAPPSWLASQAMAALLREQVAAATAAGISPDSAAARSVADELVAAYARHAETTARNSGHGCWSCWNRPPTGVTSGTGSSWRSSTAGPRRPASCPPPNG